MNTLYWSNYIGTLNYLTSAEKVSTYDTPFAKSYFSEGRMQFGKISEIYTPYTSNKLWNTSVSSSDIRNTPTISNTHFVAAIAAAGHHPSIIKNIFKAGTSNDRIFALQLYVRGKPWLLTLDN